MKKVFNPFHFVLIVAPAPERIKKTTWKEFLAQHWELLVAADFFTVEVWTRKGLQRFLVLFFIELSTRKVEIAGITSVANGLWMTQVARHVTDPVDGFLKDKRYLIHDRDPLYTAEFQTMLEGVGVKPVRLPARSPNLKNYASYCTSLAPFDTFSCAMRRLSESLMPWAL